MMTAWLTYLHGLRTREIELIFKRVPPSLFPKGLELGAGDGFQTRIRSNYMGELVCSDFSDAILSTEGRLASVDYKVCDTERVDTYFNPHEFDLVYSSNLLEHLPDPRRTLQGIHRILKDDGLTVHGIPNTFWKLCSFACFYPDLTLRTVRALRRPGNLRRVRRRMLGRPADPDGEQRSRHPLENNPKVVSRPERLFWPAPHGAYESNREELYAFSKGRWLREFQGSGFQILKVLRGPVSSGYGFGFERTGEPSRKPVCRQSTSISRSRRGTGLLMLNSSESANVPHHETSDQAA